jgi:hypothetical protein
MKTNIICLVFAALPLLAATSFDAPPAHACNIANPPIPCANVPGSNPVAGLGTLHQNQFQSVPGLNPYRFRSSAAPSPIRRFGSRDPIDGLVAPGQRDTFRPIYYGPDTTDGNAPITGRQPLPATDPSQVRPINPQDREQALGINDEMTDIVRDFFDDSGGELVQDEVLRYQILTFVEQERAFEEGREEDDSAAEAQLKQSFENRRSQGLFRVDNQSIEANDGSVLDDVESFFVAM